MDATQWGKLEALFQMVLDLPGKEREAFLERACEADPVLQSEIRSLLALSSEANTFFDRLERDVLAAAFVDLDQQTSRLPADPYRLIGETVSHFHVLDVLGRGGMGVVYRARDLKLERLVALKFLPPHFGAVEEAKLRLMYEARVASGLDHPNIATIHEVGETEQGQVFIAMACYEGETLKDRMARGTPSVPEALAIAIQVGEGLAEAHRHGIMHRDVKPANLMLTPRGGVKILDFGLAELADVNSGRRERAWGTVAYMSPEQACGEELDQRTDLWSLGVVFYEMLTGQRPFQGEDPETILHAIRHDAPAPVRTLREGVPEALAQTAERLLRKDRAERYQDTEELLADLRAIRDGSTPWPRNAGDRPQRRRAWIGSAAAAVLLLGVGLEYNGLGFNPFQTSRSPEQATASLEARPMIVVLPLENLGPAGQAYFAAGMTEEITSRLASVSALGVISRSSARHYAGTDKPLQQIGEELGVAYVLEGTVRWADAATGSSRVRITPHLSRVSDGTTVWSQTYEREMADVFAIQAEIAEAVVEQLGVRLMDRERQLVEVVPTDNLDAYHAYLQGKYYLWQKLDYGTSGVWEQAAMHFQQAVDLDPSFALGFAGLARAHASLIHFGYDVSEERHQRAQEALQQALALAPEAPEVQFTLGAYHYFVDRDYEHALKAFESAEQGMPGNSELLVIKGFVLRRQGRWDEALESLAMARQLNPQDPRASNGLAEVLHLLRRYGEVIQEFDRTIALAPDEQRGYLRKALAYLTWTGDVVAARAVLEAMPAAGNTQHGIAAWFWQEFYEGDYRAALARLPALDATFEPNWPPKPLLEAFAYDQLGEPDQARRAYDSARILLEKELDGHPLDYRRYPALRSALGVAYAGLGRWEEAVREGKAAASFLPVSRDAITGPTLLWNLALIYMMAGQQDAALDQIETLLSIPSHVSVALLQLDPRWGPLRSHPRFQALLKRQPEA